MDTTPRYTIPHDRRPFILAAGLPLITNHNSYGWSVGYIIPSERLAEVEALRAAAIAAGNRRLDERRAAAASRRSAREVCR